MPPPLRQHQTKSGATEGDIRDLLESVRLTGSLTYRQTDHKDEIIKNYLKIVADIRTPGMYDLFLSCPMSSTEADEFAQLRGTTDAIIDRLSEGGFSIYSALRKVENPQSFDPEGIAAESDLEALRRSRNFLMIYPRKILSSCILEAGYALISGMEIG